MAGEAERCPTLQSCGGFFSTIYPTKIFQSELEKWWPSKQWLSWTALGSLGLIAFCWLQSWHQHVTQSPPTFLSWVQQSPRGGWTRSRVHKKWACCPIYNTIQNLNLDRKPWWLFLMRKHVELHEKRISSAILCPSTPPTSWKSTKLSSLWDKTPKMYL